MTTINRRKILFKVQHFVENKIYKNFQKKVLHLRFGFAIITFARLKRGTEPRKQAVSKKVPKNILKKLLTKIAEHDILNELRQYGATTQYLDK